MKWERGGGEEIEIQVLSKFSFDFQKTARATPPARGFWAIYQKVVRNGRRYSSIYAVAKYTVPFCKLCDLFLGPKKVFREKIFFLPKIFLTKIFFTKIFFDQKSFEQKKCLTKNFFQPKTFLTKKFLTKNFSDKNFFGPKNFFRF